MRPCRISPYDTEAGRPVEPGHFLRSMTGRAVYEVQAARVVQRREPTPGRLRYSLSCLRVDPEQPPPDAVVHPLYWYPRGRRHR